MRSAVHPLLLLLLVVLLGRPLSATAQDSTEVPPLIQRYQAARFHRMAERILLEGEPGLPTLPVVHIPTPLDTLTATPTDTTAEPTSSGFTITDRRVVMKLERTWFDTTFANIRWAYLGRSREFTFLDTTRTRDLRARLQAVFGRPTQTLGDFDLREPRDEYVQFEYRFIVNGDIPVVVTDVDGPRGRGLIVSADARYRDSLFALRSALLDTLRQAPRAPYVDYYYEPETEQWYRTGFDGASFFRIPIRVSETTPFRRAVLDASRIEAGSTSPQTRSPPPHRNLPTPDP